MALAAATDESVAELFQVNGKGWDSRLLVNKDKISEYDCHSCGEICRDAVELGCDHKDDEITLYCNICLMDVIKQNENRCPINKSHINPPIQSNRAVRRNILKLIVYCPNSIQYKKQNQLFNNNNNNNMIRDTLQENEGVSDNKENDNYKGNDGCNWNGNLSELINKHSQQCKQICDNLNQKLIKNVNEKVNDIIIDINKIKMDNNNNNNNIKIIKENINELQNMMQNINITLSNQQNEITELKQILKQKNDEINNNKKQIKRNDSTINILKQNYENKMNNNKQEIKKCNLIIKKLEEKLQQVLEQMDKGKSGLKKVNNIEQVLEQKDEIKSNYNNNNILTKYNGKFIKANSSHCLTVINPYKIKLTKTGNWSETAKMDSILPAYNSNSNIIVYWKIQFVDNNEKNGFKGNYYFIGVISDTVSNMNNGPGSGMKDAYGILGLKGWVTRGEGDGVTDNSFNEYYILDGDITIEYDASKSHILFKKKDKQIGTTFKLPKHKRWYPAVSFNCLNSECKGQICNVLF